MLGVQVLMVVDRLLALELVAAVEVVRWACAEAIPTTLSSPAAASSGELHEVHEVPIPHFCYLCSWLLSGTNPCCGCACQSNSQNQPGCQFISCFRASHSRSILKTALDLFL